MTTKTKKRPAKKAQTALDVLCSVVLDKSGSMGIRRQDTINGFNKFLHDRQASSAEARMSLTQFDTTFDVNFTGVNVEDIPDLDWQSYTPGGGTALLDAIGQTIRQTEDWVKSNEWTGGVICLVVTDGQENASQEFTKAHIADLIKTKEKDGWEFVFIGAGIDAFHDSGQLNVSHGNTLRVNNTSRGHEYAWGSVSMAVMDYSNSIGATSGRMMAEYQDGSETTDEVK